MIGDYVKPESIIYELESTDRDEILAELTEKLLSLNSNLKREEVYSSLEKREDKESTLVSEFFAVPHIVSSAISETVIALGLSHKGIEFNNLTGEKAKIVFCIVFPENKTDEHLKILKDILLLEKNPEFRNSILSAASEADICEVIYKSGDL